MGVYSQDKKNGKKININVYVKKVRVVFIKNIIISVALPVATTKYPTKQFTGKKNLNLFFSLFFANSWVDTVSHSIDVFVAGSRIWLFCIHGKDTHNSDCAPLFPHFSQPGPSAYGMVPPTAKVSTSTST